VILWDGEEADRPAEKDLERNLSSTGFERFKPKQKLTFVTTKVTLNILKNPQF